MNNFNHTENEINFIDRFLRFLEGFNEDEFNNMDVSVLEKIISILENYNIKSGYIYEKIQSILYERKRKSISDEVDKRINEILKEKNKTEFNFKK